MCRFLTKNSKHHVLPFFRKFNLPNGLLVLLVTTLLIIQLAIIPSLVMLAIITQSGSSIISYYSPIAYHFSTLSKHSANSHGSKILAKYNFNGIAIVAKGYSSGSPKPVFFNFPIVRGTVVMHFPPSFSSIFSSRFKFVLTCSDNKALDKSAQIVLTGRSEVRFRTSCILRLPLVFEFNASVEALRYGNTVKVYVILDMTYSRNIVIPVMPNKGIVLVKGGLGIVGPTGKLLFPPAHITPLYVKFPRKVISKIKLTYVFTEPLSLGNNELSVVRVNGTYIGNILPFYVLWPSNTKEYLMYKGTHTTLVFNKIGFKLKLQAPTNLFYAYIPYTVARVYRETLHFTNFLSIVSNASFSMCVPVISGVPMTRAILNANTSYAQSRILAIIKEMKKDVISRRVSVTYLVKPEGIIRLPLVEMQSLEGVGFAYTSHYPISFIAIPLPLKGKIASILGGDSIILYGYSSANYIIPSEKQIAKLVYKVVNIENNQNHTYVTILVCTLGAISVAVLLVFTLLYKKRISGGGSHA